MEIKRAEEAVLIDKESLSKALIRDFSHYPSGLIFLIDKPYRWSSADVVRKLKYSLQRWFGVKKIKVGHAGTLDPLATGVLLLCVGKATKIAQTLQVEEKEYLAEIRVGSTTPSFDLETEIDKNYPIEQIDQLLIERVLPSFIGEQQQVPPLFSAKLIDGTRAYNLAREGKEIELKASTITINHIELHSYIAPDIKLSVRCSKGTYIRSLARDLGEALGSGAHLTALERVASGSYRVEKALSLEQLKLFLD